MRGLNFGFTIRSMMIAVALVGLNLAAAIATWNGLPREQTHKISSGPRVWPPHDVDGPVSVRFDLGNLETGERLVRVVRRRRPTLVEIWSPAIASVSITLIVLHTLWRQARPQRADPVIGLTASFARGDNTSIPVSLHQGRSGWSGGAAGSSSGENVGDHDRKRS
jgi:hypothetical protein